MCHPFLEEPGGEWGSGVPDTASSLALCDTVPWGKGDKRRIPRYCSDGDLLSRLWVFALFALAQWVPSWSCTPGARVLGRNAQALLHLAQQILNASVCLCEACGHRQHGCTSCTVSGGAGSSQHFSTLSRSFAPWLLLPQPAADSAPLLFASWTLILPQDKLQTASPETASRLQAWDLHFSQVTDDPLCLSPSTPLHAGIVQSRAVRKLELNYYMLSSISLGSNTCGMYHPPETLVLGDESLWTAALWNLSVSQHLRVSGC